MSLRRCIALLAVGMLPCMHSGAAAATDTPTALHTLRLQTAPGALPTVAVHGPSFSALAAIGSGPADRMAGVPAGMLNQAERRSAIDPDMQPGPPEDTPWGWMLLAAAAAAAMLARRRPLD